MKRRNLHHLLHSGPSRRSILRSGVTLSGALVAGCTTDGRLGDDDDSAADDDDAATDDDDATDVPDPMCSEAFDDATFLELLPFENDESTNNLETTVGTGHDARLYTDLRTLDVDALTISNSGFYIRTEFPDLLEDTDDWQIRVRGLATETDLALDDLSDLIVDMGNMLLECSGNGSFGNMGLLSSAEWSGIPLGAVLDLIDIDPAATRVLLSGFDDRTQVSTHSTPGASWIFTFAELEEAGAFLATHMNGELLPDDHGFPVRLFVPGWFGCCAIKWLDEIRFVDEDEPATDQMREFASRTHQNGVPAMARDFVPAVIDTAAMPVRVEKFEMADGSLAYRIIGIVWGGDVAEPPIQVHFGGSAGQGGEWFDVNVCPARPDAHAWGLWWFTWRPKATGRHYINCRIDDPSIRTQRLETGGYLRYERDVIIDEI